MPHQCTDCGRAFSDGSKEMLSGCPDCGGNTFQFRPSGALEQAGDTVDGDIVVADEEPPERPVDSTVARTVGKAATTVRDFVGSGQAPETPPGAGVSAGESARADAAQAEEGEDTAQAAARSDVASPTDISDDTDQAGNLGTERSPGGDDADGPTPSEEPVDRPELADLRAELNDQFESIKVLQPGRYELNLMELYDREEYIIALQEDGRYTIQVPDGYAEP